ncbi:hypothetical protein ACK8P5_26235 (plasmid) [Paenibacillus sp. EC2-1]|uniref:hypothetical protein n=1 Tax=Paenibacillus sp. EC2-1 TaxID=3388665 RepID=UPI003BEF3A97
MISVQLPTYYSAEMRFIEEDGRYFMEIAEWSISRTEISKSFYLAATAEFKDTVPEFKS